MRRQFNNIISVSYTFFRMLLLKVINGKKIQFHFVERISPNVVIELNRGGSLELGERVRIHSGCKLKVRKNGRFVLGEDVKINYGCMFFCHDEIVINAGVEFGPNVLIYDHDHDFRNSGGLKAGYYKSAPVRIGENSWIGANSVILKGTNIGKDCVIAAGSIVQGNVPDGRLFVQKKEKDLINITHVF